MIQNLWVGRPLSVMERLSVASFLRNGHPYHLYVYENPGPVPQGTVLQDAQRVVPADRIFTYRRYPSYAGFSNLFRYRLLVERGGVWADTDVAPVDAFCPVDWWRWRRDTAGGQALPLGIHLWHEMWRRSRTDPDCPREPGSIYAQVKKRYLE